MTMPFYVSPEQVMKDRADYARKGIARGRSLVALEAADGIAIVAENPSRTLFKISGVRHADLKGYSYSREDVNARSLANAYAQTLGQVFTHEMKPYEVEILVAEVGRTPDHPDELFHILYDGVMMDKEGFTVLGGQAETITAALESEYAVGSDLGVAVRLGAKVLAPEDGEPLTAAALEVALLDRSRTGRTFRRLKGDELTGLLDGAAKPVKKPVKEIGK